MPDPVPVVLQTNFGSAQTGVKWQMYDQSGLYGSATDEGVTNPITGIYTVETAVTGFIGIQWTCDNAALTRQQDLGALKLLDQIHGQIEVLTLFVGIDIAGLIAAIPTANENADALLDQAAGVETGRTVRESLRVMLAALAGKLSGAGTAEVKIRDQADTKDRITATVVSGNRTAITLDLT